jgi:hypothetical protein
MELISRIRTTAWLLALFITVLLLQTPLYGQATGNVIGSVADKTGALIPNASVILRDGLNGTTRKTTSNGSGQFAFSSVLPSTLYTLKVSAPNFAPWESQPFALRPGDQLRFNDIKLQVGAASDTVTVEAVSDSVKDLDTGERSDVITAKEISTLAVVGRDAGELLAMLPGFTTQSNGVNNQPNYNTAVVGLSGPSGAFSANGNGTNGTAVVADGVSLTDISSNAGTVQSLNMDMISEVKVSTSAFSAESAKGPGVVNAVIKSGTSSFHGSAYFYTRNTDLNANDWYNNYLQQSRPTGTYYYPGGTIGGPVMLPFTKYNRNKDKLFFFFSYENYRQNYLGATLGSWVPTMSERNGFFDAGTLNAELCGGRPDGLANPNAIQPMCYTHNYMPDGSLVANGNVNSWVNQGGRALVNWLPLPNADPFTNASGYNYIQEVQQTQNGSQLHGKLDYNLSENDKIFVSYGRQAQISQDPIDFGYVPAGSMQYPGGVTAGDLSNTISANFTHIFSASLTSEFTAAMSFVSSPGNMDTPGSVSRFNMNATNCQNAVLRAAGNCGSSGYGDFNYLGMYKNAGDYSVPALADWSNNGYPNMLMPGGFYANHVRMKKVVPDIQENVTWSKGRHFLKAGFYGEQGHLNGLADYASAYPQGEYTFNPGNGYFMWSSLIGGESQFVGCQSPDPAGTTRLSGAAYLGNCMNPVAMMYTGYADSYAQTNFSPTVDMQYQTLAGFAEDSVKLHRLTLHLGARFEHLGGWSDRHNNGLATFEPSLYAQQCTGTTAATLRTCNSQYIPGMSWHGQNTGVSNSVNTPPAVWISPRVGVAWDAYGNGDTVVRGGWGIYRATEEFNPYALAAATAQGYKTSYLTGQLSYDFIDSHSPVNPTDFSAYTVSPTDSDRPIHYEYNVAVSQKAPWRSLIEFAYVGSDHTHLATYNNGNYNNASDLNRIPLGGLYQVNLGLLSQAGLTQIDNSGTDLSNMSTADYDFFRTYPFYQHIYELHHVYYAKYNSAQVSWNKNAGRVSFGGNYTFSKDLATAASYNNNIVDPINLGNDYNPVPFDHTQVFNVHYLIDLGKLYKGGGKLLSEAANGWQISGISTVQSGPPLASLEGENFGFGWGSINPVALQYTNQANSVMEKECDNVYRVKFPCANNMNQTVWLGTPDVQLMPTVLCNPGKSGVKNQFVNPTCFGIPAPETNGQFRLPYIHGPAYSKHDVTVMKNFYLGEKRNLQIRGAAFNFLNHPLISFNNNDTSNLQLAFQNGAVGQALTNSMMTHKDFGIAGVKYGFRLMELSAKFDF